MKNLSGFVTADGLSRPALEAILDEVFEGLSMGRLPKLGCAESLGVLLLSLNIRPWRMQE